MKNKNKFIILTVIIIFLSLLIIVIIYKYNIYNNPNSLNKAIKNKKGYSIVYISGNVGDIVTEEYFIVDNNKEIIDEIKILTGYSDEDLNILYNQLMNNGEPVVYNLRIKNKSLVYNSVMFNGKNINDIIESLKESPYSNLNIKEI